MRWFVIVAVCACGSDKTAPPPTAGSAIANHVIDAPAAPPAPLGKDGLPIVCGEWKAAIDKLSTCAAIPQNARDSLIAVYKDASRDWGQLPADAKRNLIVVCRAGADSVLKGAKATCGW